MGCLQSKKESTDLHPNIFRVINIAENGSDLCSGQLEVTESDIILYREGRDSTVWPLHSLRRYGFEGEIFSFESGRRCETGEGIYAFRCRRASLLFRTLQQRIQIRNVVHESAPYPASRLTPSPQGRQTLQATVIHRSSIDIGHLDIIMPNINSNLPGIFRNEANAPQSPSSIDILEVMPLYPREHSTSSQVTNIYLLKDFKREHNNNDSGSVDPQHVYCNDFTRDLAKLRNTLRQEQVLNTMRDIEDENIFLESRYMNEFMVDKQNNNPLSPTLSNASEHYAQLSSEQQEAARSYMNVIPNEAKGEVNKFNAIPSKPLTPKSVAYCNLAIGSKSELNSYANLSLGDLGDSSKTLRYVLSSKGPFEHRRKFSQSDTIPSMSLGDGTELTYAILDIKTNEGLEMVREMMESEVYAPSQNEAARAAVEASTQPRPRLKSQCSMEQAGPAAGSTAAVPPALGYTIIDFDKTVALTSVAAGGEVDAEGPRKTRHNSCNIGCGSPVVADKNNKQNN